MAFGEGDEGGPPQVGLRPGTYQVHGAPFPVSRCIAVPESTTSAMVALSPRSESWDEVPAWTSDLEPLAADRASGQAWLDGHRAEFESHRALAEARYAAFRPSGKMLATIQPDDDAAPR